MNRPILGLPSRSCCLKSAPVMGEVLICSFLAPWNRAPRRCGGALWTIAEVRSAFELCTIPSMYSWRLFFALAAVPLFGASCDSLVSLRLPDTSVVSAHVETGEQLIPPGEKETIAGGPDFCRGEAVLRPAQNSNVRVEVWLPITEWNGKFQGVGNGGFAGTLNFSSTNG